MSAGRISRRISPKVRLSADVIGIGGLGMCVGPYSQPKTEFLSYGVGGGVRWDVAEMLVLRAGVRQQWIDFPSSGAIGFTTFKFDIGWLF